MFLAEKDVAAKLRAVTFLGLREVSPVAQPRRLFTEFFK